MMQQPQAQAPLINPQDSEFNTERLGKNMNHMRNMRTYGAINAGILCGCFGMDGFHGFPLYLVMFGLVSLCILIKTEFQSLNYFTSKNEVLFGGVGNDVLLFLMVWVIFHNLVNIL